MLHMKKYIVAQMCGFYNRLDIARMIDRNYPNCKEKENEETKRPGPVRQHEEI